MKEREYINKSEIIKFIEHSLEKDGYDSLGYDAVQILDYIKNMNTLLLITKE